MTEQSVFAEISFERDLCAAWRFARSTCSLCVSACPKSAIERVPGGIRIASSCDGCGLCLASCPTGALDLAHSRRSSLLRRISDKARAKKALVRCQRAAWSTGAGSVPCAGSLLDCTLLELVLRHGIADVTLRVGDCASCPRGEACAETLRRTLSTVRGILVSCGRSPDAVRVERSPDKAADHGPRNEGRRKLFATLLGIDHWNSPGKSRSRRDALMSLWRSQGPPFLPAGLPSMPAARLRIDPAACSGCNVCEHVCPSGAITRIETEKAIAILADEDSCTACGSCAEACLFSAIRLEPAPAERAPAGAGRRRLASLTRKDCPSCGDPFASGSSASTHCPACRRTAHENR
ncbi:MAG: 4Fe-4S binding protein [Planctomycetota bacterium]